MLLEQIPIINNFLNPVIREGAELILLDCSKTQFPEVFNEGVYVWMENRKLRTSLEYHEAKGGDPKVLYDWLICNGQKPDFQPL